MMKRSSRTLLLLALGIALIWTLSGCETTQPRNDSVAVALPADWEQRCGVSVVPDSPTLRPDYLAVPKEVLIDLIRQRQH